MGPYDVSRAVVAVVLRERPADALFHVRDASTGGIRAMEKYVENLEDIRRIQTYVVARARREGVPVVENANVDRTIDAVIELVMGAAERARQVA